uniref:centrosomal protein 43 n=1 Tax=Monopterus albus TaxID=43700 RepID=UPI0009B39C92|nr:FGFR1 oncogene partner [Monopterus albus]
MSAAEDDTELRDLLIQNLENSGVLNKLKAEMRAAVFLAMEEQDKVENKTPLINENMKKCLSTKDGRLVASLILDFLQVFNLDFTLAVFQPEINSLNGLDGRDQVCRELGLSESEVNRNSPVLLELIRRGRHNDKPTEGDRSGHIRKVVQDSDDSPPQTHPPEEKTSAPPVSKIPRYKGQNHRGQSEPAAKDSEGVMSLGKADFQQQVSDKRMTSFGLKKGHLELEAEYNLDDGDSFFDDPLPKPQKTYGCVVPLREESLSGPVVSPMRRGKSLDDLSVLAGDSEGERDESVSAHSQSSGLRNVEASKTRESPVGSLSEALRPGGGGGGSNISEQSHSKNGASDSREKGLRDSKALNDKTGSLHLDDDVEYDDDFNSHRSDLSKSELSIGEDIEEVSIEGPDHSDKLDESTQDLSISQLSQSHGADYMEEVA